jgi:hypothetical protein
MYATHSSQRCARASCVDSICFAQVATIFNLFITYGDTFLPSPADYDELYYELIRVRKLIDAFYSNGIARARAVVALLRCVTLVY